MAKLLKLRRGTTSQHSSFTGAEGEVTVDTDKESLVVHNGSNAGGYPLAREDLSNVSSSSITGRLGTGSIVKAKLEADIIDGTKLADDAVAQEHIADEAVNEARIQISNAGSNGQFLQKQSGNAGGLTWATVDTSTLMPLAGGTFTNDVTFTGANYNAFWDKSDNSLRFTDNSTLKIGDHAGTGDLRLYHDATDSWIKNATGDLRLCNTNGNGNEVKIGAREDQDGVIVKPLGATELYNNGTKRLETTGSGVSITGNLGLSGNVDGRDIAADGTKLDGIESGATADQSASEILTAVKTVDGASSGLDADLLDGKHDTSFLRSDAGGGAASYNATSSITFSAGASAVNVAANSDIRYNSGSWTGDTTTPKIQGHGNSLYVCGGTAGIIFRENNTNRWSITGDGHYTPSTDSTYDIGSNGTRVRNLYADTLYGDGSNLTGVQPFPSGTKMIFQQTAAPTGWTKITSSVDNRALRLVSGTVGSGGNSAFTTAFASYTPAGNIAATANATASFSANATTGNSTASFSGSVSGNTGNSGANTSSVSTSGTVNNHTLSVAQMPSHSHSFTRRTPGSYASYGGTATNWDANSANNGNTHNTGGGGSHSHGFSGSSHSHSVNNHTHSFSGNVSGNTGNHTHSVSVSGTTGNHTHTSGAFSGTARDFAVQYIDVIVASKD